MEEEQTMQWPKDNGQKDKQWSTKHYTENYRSSNTNPTKTGGELKCSGRVSSSSPCVTPVMLLTTYIYILYMNEELKCKLSYFAFQSLDIKRTWWGLSQKRIVRTKLDIYGLIIIHRRLYR